MTRLMMKNVIARPTSMTRRRRRRDRQTLPEPRRSAEPELRVSDQRGGDRPQDEATYRCGCGYVFTAAVSTSVGCPYCGDAQAW
jgi:hypothetical protein